MTKYILPNGSVWDSSQGGSPPTGALALPDQTSTGVDPNIFSAAQNNLQATTRQGNDTTIPVFRDKPVRLPGVTKQMIHKDGETQVVFKKGTTGAVPTPEQFNQDMANAKFSEILFDKGKLEAWQKLVVQAGLLTPAESTDAVKLEKAWQTAVGWAINIKAATKGATEVTPFEALQAIAQNTGAATLAAQSYAADHFTGTKTTTSSSTNTTYGAQEGEALRQLLGRNPTPAEEKAYRRGLADYAAANPTVTKQSTTYQNGEAVAQDTQTSGGYDANAAAYQSAATATPEVAANQQATTYYDALVKALGSAV